MERFNISLLSEGAGDDGGSGADYSGSGGLYDDIPF